MKTSITKIVPELSHQIDLFTQIEKIFFQTSSVQSFSSIEGKELFKNRWLTPYLRLADSFCSIWVAMDGQQVLGYLTGHSHTDLYRKNHDHISLSIFADLHVDFPAHLHINMAPGQQGKGLGAALIHAYLQELKSQAVVGVHLVTGPKARNTSFYRREGFTVESMRSFETTELLFMGQKLE